MFVENLQKIKLLFCAFGIEQFGVTVVLKELKQI